MKRGYETGGTNISENRAHNHLNFIKMSHDYTDEEIVEPTLYKIQETIRTKMPGNDNINAELLQVAGPQMTQRIQ